MTSSNWRERLHATKTGFNIAGLIHSNSQKAAPQNDQFGKGITNFFKEKNIAMFPYYTNAAIEQFATLRRLERTMKELEKAELVIIDEWGYLPMDREEAQLLFQVMASSYERRSTILTTNPTIFLGRGPFLRRYYGGEPWLSKSTIRRRVMLRLFGVVA